MNRRLRIRHRWMSTVLAAAVPIGFALAIMARPDMPVVTELPGAIAAPAGNTDWQVLASEMSNIEQSSVVFELLQHPAQPDRYAVSVQPLPRQAVRAPDVLIYWSDAAQEPTSGLPDGAQYLGSLAGTQRRLIALPDGAGPGSGQVLFYSLGHNRLLDGGWRLPANGVTP